MGKVPLQGPKLVLRMACAIGTISFPPSKLFICLTFPLRPYHRKKWVFSQSTYILNSAPQAARGSVSQSTGSAWRTVGRGGLEPRDHPQSESEEWVRVVMLAGAGGSAFSPADPWGLGGQRKKQERGRPDRAIRSAALPATPGSESSAMQVGRDAVKPLELFKGTEYGISASGVQPSPWNSPVFTVPQPHS